MRRSLVHAGRSSTPDGANRILTAALVAPLVLLLAVAAMTWHAERRVHAVTDRVVRDYAALAVWQYARRASIALHDEAMQAFATPLPPRGGSTLRDLLRPPAALLQGRGPEASVFLRHARFAFSFDGQRLAHAGAAIGAETEAMLRRQFDGLPQLMDADNEPHRVLFASAEGHDLAIAVWVLTESDSPDLVVQGIAVDVTALDALFTRVLRDPGLLPVPRDSSERAAPDLALRVSRPTGELIHATALELGATAATDSTGVQGRGVHVTLDIPPALAEELLIGGPFRSRLPALALMIVVALGLAVVGLVHDSRSRALARARARFVADVSHELRTPLAQISMFAETLHLARERSEAERRTFAGIIFAEARRLTALVEKVLRFSRSEHADLSLRPQSHRVADLLANAVSAFAPIADAASVTIELSVRGGPLVWADASAFQQMMLNLLDNAVKHGGRGRVVVSATAASDRVHITVDDAGPGIPAEWRDRVMEPFTRVDGRNTSGAGIGLAIVRDLARAHEGDVEIGDSPQGGARITISLPHHIATMPPPARPAATTVA